MLSSIAAFHKLLLIFGLIGSTIINYTLSLFLSSVIPLCLSQITANAAMTALGSYTKVTIAVVLHSDKIAPDIALILNGICTQLGALIGAVVFFSLVYSTDLF